MRNNLLLIAAIAAFALPSSAPAQDSAAILAARQAGLIGERYDGYVGVVTSSAPAQLRRQVAALNIRRRTLYANLAARKGVSPEEVGITTACSLFRRIGVGEFYLPNQGGWRRVVAGQSPVPAYCV